MANIREHITSQIRRRRIETEKLRGTVMGKEATKTEANDAVAGRSEFALCTPSMGMNS